jgi:hypothetical protein
MQMQTIKFICFNNSYRFAASYQIRIIILNNTADKSGNICSASCKICPKIPEVVVLPCVPATAKQKYLCNIP